MYDKRMSRKSISYAQRLLRSHGIDISEGTIRRYADAGLFPSLKATTGHITYRSFSEADLTRLEIVAILKKLGMTDVEARDWLATPIMNILTARIRAVRKLLARADMLAASLTSQSQRSG